jgi:hypothetical protein
VRERAEFSVLAVLFLCKERSAELRLVVVRMVKFFHPIVSSGALVFEGTFFLLLQEPALLSLVKGFLQGPTLIILRVMIIGAFL